MPSLIAYLNGGLGNQMFQYATARALALDHQAELFVDPWSGFVRDFEYKRRYELDAFTIKAHKLRPWQSLPIWLYRWEHRSKTEKPNFIEQKWYGQFIAETEFRYLPKLQTQLIDRTTWLVGYWQSPRYFEHYAKLILDELMPPLPTKSNYLALGEQIRQSESVALGIRLYEESVNPGIHSSNGRMKTATEINTSIKNLQANNKSTRFFVFCTHHSAFLNQLDLSEDAVMVTAEDGFDDTLATLWLISQCRHHIFTNSSYYWWGAWLSAANYGGTKSGQEIWAANNFYNPDTPCEDWQQF